MAEFDKRKINIKIFDPPLTGNQIAKYTEFKGMHITGSPNESLLGEVVIDDKLFGTLVLKKEIWSDNLSRGPNYDFLDRIVIKFLQRTGTAIGTIEERLFKEFALYPVSERLPLFAIILKSLPYFIDFEIEQSDRLIFPLPNKTGKGVFDVFQFDRKVGNSFTIKKKFLDRKIATIDPKRGGKIEIKITDENSANDDDLIASLVLFAGTIKYYDEITIKIRHGTKGISEGSFILCPPENELKSMIYSPEVKLAKKGKEKLKPHKKEVEVLKKEEAPAVAIQEQIEILQKSSRKSKKAVDLAPTEKMGATIPAELEVAPIHIKKAKKATTTDKMLEVAPTKKTVEKRTKKVKGEVPAKKAEIEAPSIEPILAEPAEKVSAEKPFEILEIEQLPKPVKIKEPIKKEILKSLTLEDSIKEIQGITEKYRILLENIGIEIVDDLLFVDPEVIAEKIGHKDVTPLKIKEWQLSAEKRIKATQQKKEA